jgi:hypothetical protein
LRQVHRGGGGGSLSSSGEPGTSSSTPRGVVMARESTRGGGVAGRRTRGAVLRVAEDVPRPQMVYHAQARSAPCFSVNEAAVTVSRRPAARTRASRLHRAEAQLALPRCGLAASARELCAQVLHARPSIRKTRAIRLYVELAAEGGSLTVTPAQHVQIWTAGPDQLLHAGVSAGARLDPDEQLAHATVLRRDHVRWSSWAVAVEVTADGAEERRRDRLGPSASGTTTMDTAPAATAGSGGPTRAANAGRRGVPPRRRCRRRRHGRRTTSARATRTPRVCRALHSGDPR